MRLITALALLLPLVSCGPAGDTGTRHEGPPLRVGVWGVHYWPTANATMRLYLRETMEEHVALLNRHLHGEAPPNDPRVHFYQIRTELLLAYRVAQNAYSSSVPLPLILPVGTPGNGVAFIHPWDGSLHIWAGALLQADQLAHGLLHVVIGPDPGHLDPRWPRLLAEDWTLSFVIAARR